MYLLDTMIVSEMRRPDQSSFVAQWLRTTDVRLMFVSVITFGEIAAGREKKHIDPIFRIRLSRWLEDTKVQFIDRTIVIDTAVALRWGALSMRLRRQDMDVLIAATALEHDLTLVTRNVRHFEPTGVRLFNPYP